MSSSCPNHLCSDPGHVTDDEVSPGFGLLCCLLLFKGTNIQEELQSLHLQVSEVLLKFCFWEEKENDSPSFPSKDKKVNRAHTEQQPQPGARTSSTQAGREEAAGQAARRSGVHGGQRNRSSEEAGAPTEAKKSSSLWTSAGAFVDTRNPSVAAFMRLLIPEMFPFVQ
ncbi:unnamed protein product [Ranitomeya imitator]|uniref:Uncharacterized protein n=1 Tax=Ranitomeya imitator TaxID=111125 RepID=A0ABN9LRY1_9NEOB|nr:unnamed protein product [Ranitomeya imitator]